MLNSNQRRTFKRPNSIQVDDQIHLPFLYLLCFDDISQQHKLLQNDQHFPEHIYYLLVKINYLSKAEV